MTWPGESKRRRHAEAGLRSVACPVDRLVRDAYGLIIREVDLESIVRDLLIGGDARLVTLVGPAAERSPPALRSWAAWPAARPSTARPTPDSPASHHAWLHCDAAAARTSRGCGPAGGRSPEPPRPGRGAPQ